MSTQVRVKMLPRFGATGVVWKGVWSATVAYTPGNSVLYINSSYISKSSNINKPPATSPADWDLMAGGAAGPPGPSGPQGMIWKGGWSSAAAYLVGDGVAYNGNSYICVVAHAATATPPLTANWNLIAAAGAAGSGAVLYSGSQVLTDDTLPVAIGQRSQARANIYAAPFDALAYNGMQVNGSFDVSQEVTPGTGVSGNKYVCDGWYGQTNGTPVATFFTDAVGVILPNVCYNAITTPAASLGAADTVGVMNRIEGYRISRLTWGTANAQPITIAFWTAHHRTGTYTATIRNNTNDRCYAFSYTQNAGDTYEYKTVNIPGCTNGTWEKTNLIGMIINFCMASGSTFTAPSLNTWVNGNYVAGPGQINGVAATSDVMRITCVVVLPGIEAPSAARSPFIMRPYDQELVTCQRYYYKRDVNILGYGSAGLGNGLWLPHVLPMRIAPAVALSSITYTNASALTADIISVNGFRNFATVTALGQFAVTATHSVDARL